MEKFMVRRGFTTPGCAEFRKDMEYWQTHPIVEYEWSEGEAGRVIEVKTRTPIDGWSIWRIEEQDLIPYKPKMLENK